MKVNNEPYMKHHLYLAIHVWNIQICTIHVYTPMYLICTCIDKHKFLHTCIYLYVHICTMYLSVHTYKWIYYVHIFMRNVHMCTYYSISHKLIHHVHTWYTICVGFQIKLQDSTWSSASKAGPEWRRRCPSRWEDTVARANSVQ